MKLKRTSQERWWLYICFLKALKIVSKCPHQARPVLFKNCLTLSVFGLETGFFFALIRILPEINWSQSQEHKLTSQINKASITIKNHKDGSTNAVKIIFPYLKIWDLWPNWNCNKLKLSQWEEIKARYNMKTRFSFFFQKEYHAKKWNTVFKNKDFWLRLGHKFATSVAFLGKTFNNELSFSDM